MATPTGPFQPKDPHKNRGHLVVMKNGGSLITVTTKKITASDNTTQPKGAVVARTILRRDPTDRTKHVTSDDYGTAPSGTTDTN
jgi:hypothetical protein